MEDNNIDLNVGGKPQERFMLLRYDELPEFTEEEAGAIKNLMSNRKDKPGDKFGTVLLLGTGGDPSALHAARTMFKNDDAIPGGTQIFPGLWERPKASDYIVSYDPIGENRFSMENIVIGMREALTNLKDWGIVIKNPLSFRKIEGPGTGPWKKRVKAKNRYKNQTRKLIENYRQKDFSDYYARATIFPPLDPDQNALPDTINKL